MSLLAAGELAKLFLGDALDEAVDAGKDLFYVLRVDEVHLRAADELLDPQHALAVEMVAHPLVDLVQDAGPKGSIVALLKGENLVEEAAGLELAGGEALAHDEGLVCPGGAEAVDHCARGAALRDEAEGGKGGEQEGMGHGVDEVGKADEGGGEADDGAVEADDEDLGVRGEGVSDVEVEGGKGGEPEAVRVSGGVGSGAGDADVGAATRGSVNATPPCVSSEGGAYAEK